MQKNTWLIPFIVVMTLLFTLSTQAQSSRDTVTTQDIEKETKELINTVQQFTVEQRDQAVKKIDQALKKLDAQIEELEGRVDDNWNNMTNAARQKTRANLKTLRQQRIKLAEQYGSLKNSSISAWEQMKKGFSNAYQSVSDSWEKAIDEYSTEDN